MIDAGAMIDKGMNTATSQAFHRRPSRRATQIGYSRLGLLGIPISDKPEIGSAHLKIWPEMRKANSGHYLSVVMPGLVPRLSGLDLALSSHRHPEVLGAERDEPRRATATVRLNYGRPLLCLACSFFAPLWPFILRGLRYAKPPQDDGERRGFRVYSAANTRNLLLCKLFFHHHRSKPDSRGLVPGIHVLTAFSARKSWMAATSAAMTAVFVASRSKGPGMTKENGVNRL